MKTAIIYYSKHHGNTKKLLGGIAKGHPNQEEIQRAVEFYDTLEDSQNE